MKYNENRGPKDILNIETNHRRVLHCVMRSSQAAMRKVSGNKQLLYYGNRWLACCFLSSQCISLMHTVEVTSVCYYEVGKGMMLSCVEQMKKN
jgi:hypothetical protein